jgi:hypothetical protein
VQVERLTAARVLALERGRDEILVELADGRTDGPPARGGRLDDRDVAEPGERHVQRPRDRRRRQREHVDLEPKRAEELLLGDSEALLLVEDDEAQLLGDDVAREETMGPDEHLDLPLLELAQDPRLVGLRAEARHHLDPDGEVAIALSEGVPVLLGEDRRRTEDERLLPVQRGCERGAHGNLGLAEADVAAHEAVHRAGCLEILLDRLDRLQLVVRLAVGEGRLEPLQPVLVEIEGEARRLLASCIEREELSGQLTDGGARATLEVLPRLAAELRQRRGGGVRADVAADLRKLLVRDVEPVLALEREVEVVARDARDLLRLEAEELPDAVVLVHDVVAGSEVGEGLQRSAEPRVGARRALAEDLHVGQKRDAEVTPDEAASRRADDEAQDRILRQRQLLLDDVGVDLAKQALRALRLALVREGDQHAPPLPEHPGELGLGLGEPARGDRWALGFEPVRLRVREGIERGRVVERHRIEAVLLPDAPDVLRLPDDVRWAAHRRYELVRPGRSGLVVEARLGRQRRLDEVSPPLGRGVDHCVFDRTQRALREGRERADLLDLVAEELHAQWLTPGARENVDEPAADRQLAAFLHSVDALVPSERERLDERVEPELVSDRDPDRGRPLVLKRQAFRERPRGSSDEASGREDVERAGALADEMRRRVEPGTDRDSPTREKGNVRGIDVPRDRLRCVAGVLVLGENGEESALARLVERSEHERQRGVGHSRVRRKVVGEGPKRLAFRERGDERVER